MSDLYTFCLALLTLTSISLTILITQTRFIPLIRLTGTAPQASLSSVSVSRLTLADVSILILLIILKYPAKLLRLLPRLQSNAAGTGFNLPSVRISSAVLIDHTDEERYDAATQLRSFPHSPTSLSNEKDSDCRPLLLPALVNPLLSIILSSRCCPVLPFGSVNTKNRFTFRDLSACRKPLRELDVSAGIYVVAAFGGPSNPGRRVKRGMEFDVVFDVTAVRKGQEDRRTILRQVATVLVFLPRDTRPLFAEESADSTSTVRDLDNSYANDQGDRWSKSQDKLAFTYASPSLWAAVCKDYNPIHASGLMARLFGFQSKIAHGNHVLACAIAQLGCAPRTSAAEGMYESLFLSEEPCDLLVLFKRPMVVPSTMAFEWAKGHNSSKLRMQHNGKDHLVAETLQWQDI